MAAPGRNVVIVGAGLAGLACASSLRKAGLSVVVLEARDRVGGRVRTDVDLVPGRPIEAGAMMVHGRDVRLHAWIWELGLTLRRVPAFRGARFFVKGKLRSPWGILLSGVEPLLSSLQTLWSLPRAVARYDGPDVTLDRFLAERRALPTATRFVGVMYGSVNAADPGEVSVRGLAEEANASSLGLPWANYQILEGFEELARRRARELGDAVQLRTRVDRIEWSQDGVRTHATGPEGPQIHEAAAAVVTVPLGVLKARGIAFEPDLPEAKRQAIEALGYGDANKVLLVFDDALKKTVLGKASSIASTDGTWYFLPYHGRKDAPLVLEGFLAGRKARALAGKSQEETIDAVLADLARMVPGVDLEAHLKAARFVDWTSDPYSRGGYSYPRVSGGLAQRLVLAEPLDGVLFFAGEATHARGEYATIHGALSSGERAAREVLAAVRAS